MAYYYGDGNYQKPNNNQNQNQNPNKRPEWVSWIIIAAFLSTIWPVGVIMLIMKLVELSSRKTTTQTRQPTAQQRQQQQQWQQQQQQLRQQQQQQQQQQQKQQQQAAAQQTAAQKTAAPVKRSTAVSSRKKALEYGKKKTRLLDIFGWILAAFGTIGLASELGDIVTAGSVMDFVGLALGAGLLSGGIGMLLGSWRIKRRARRFAKYLAAGGKKEAIDINRLAEAAEVREPIAERDVEIMVEKGLWGSEAYVDNTNDMLFRTQEAAAKYFDQKNPMRERFTTAVPTQADEGFSGMLRNIRRANDRIADPGLSAKIDRLEEITGRIFKTIEEHPERRDKANTFLNYYLPTTQKLLDSYADFEEAGVSGANLSQAKERIEKTMDNIVAGFEHQLDQLYQAEAMDVDSDIRVMENMLRRDTGTVEDDFGLTGGTAVQEYESE